MDIEKALLTPDNLVKADVIVKLFHFDNSSGNKFFLLEVGGFTFNAIIYNDTKTPYISQGNFYIFYGATQKYEDRIEFEIATVE